MYVCVCEQFGEGFYSSVEDFEEMCLKTWGEESVPDLRYGPDEGYSAIINGTETKVLDKLFFIVRDGEKTNSKGYRTLSAALYAADDLFGEQVSTEAYDSETKVKTIYGELLATQAIGLADSEESLATPESHTATIVW